MSLFFRSRWLILERCIALVFLVRSGGGTAALDVVSHECGQFFDEFRLLIDEIVRFTAIFGQVVELVMGQAFHIGAAGSGITPAAGTGAESEFPIAFADSEGAVDGMVDNRFAEGRLIFPGQGGENADTVFAGIVGIVGPNHISAGGEQVGGADDLVAPGAGFHFGWPLSDEGDAVTTLVDVRFVSAEVEMGLMTVLSH